MTMLSNMIKRQAISKIKRLKKKIGMQYVPQFKEIIQEKINDLKRSVISPDISGVNNSQQPINKLVDL